MLHNHLADLAAAPVAAAEEVFRAVQARLFQLAAAAAAVAAEYYRGPAAPAVPALLQPAVRAVVQILLAQKPVHLIPVLVVAVAVAGVHLELLALPELVVQAAKQLR